MTRSGSPGEDSGAACQALVVDVRLDPQGPVVGSEPVTESDLVDSYSELWWRGHLRKGHPEVRLDELNVRLHPLFTKDRRPWCTGYTLETVNPGGKETICVFGNHSVEHVAQRAVQQLQSAGVLKAGESYYYQLRADGAPRARGPASSKVAAGGVRIASPGPSGAPLRFLHVPLQPLLERARNVGHDREDVRHQVFYTEEALEKAEHDSRRGERSNPPVESGGVLVGPLCSCPETGEMFSVITDVLEASDAEGSTFSFSYSSLTWARIQAIMKARQARSPSRADRILGQTHGHNFLPLNGAPPCEMCSKVEVCGRSTAFLSTDDLQWCRAVFSGQPWQVSHVFGLNARSEPVDAFYGQHAGCLQQRGYQLVSRADFESLRGDLEGGRRSP